MIHRFRKLKERYQSVSKAKKATFWITLSSFVQRGISFITVPVFTRVLSPADYGSVSVYSSWESVAVYLVTLGVTYGGFNNGMIKFKDDREGYTSSVMGLVTTMGFLWLAVCLHFSGQVYSLTGLPLVLIFLLFVEVVSSGVYDVWVSRMKFDFEYRKMVAASLLLAVFCPALAILFISFAEDKVLARIASFVAVEAVFALVLGIAMMKQGRKVFSWKYWKFTLLFNIPLLPHYLSQVILSSSDRILIGNMCSVSDAGVYSIAYSVGMIMTLLTSSLNSTVVPWLYRKLDGKEYGRIRKMSVVLLGGIAVAVLFIDALAPDIVAILAPPEYGEAMSLVPIISASVFFMFVYSYCSNIEFFYEKRGLATAASMLAALLNVFLNIVLIPVIGYQAAGFTTMACYIAMSVAHYAFAQRVTRASEGVAVLDGRSIWGIGIAFCVVSVLFSGLYAFALARYALVATLLVVAIWKRDAIVSKLKEGLS